MNFFIIVYAGIWYASFRGKIIDFCLIKTCFKALTTDRHNHYRGYNKYLFSIREHKKHTLGIFEHLRQKHKLPNMMLCSAGVDVFAECMR